MSSFPFWTPYIGLGKRSLREKTSVNATRAKDDFKRNQTTSNDLTISNEIKRNQTISNDFKRLQTKSSDYKRLQMQVTRTYKRLLDPTQKGKKAKKSINDYESPILLPNDLKLGG